MEMAWTEFESWEAVTEARRKFQRFFCTFMFCAMALPAFAKKNNEIIIYVAIVRKIQL